MSLLAYSAQVLARCIPRKKKKIVLFHKAKTSKNYYARNPFEGMQAGKKKKERDSYLPHKASCMQCNALFVCVALGTHRYIYLYILNSNLLFSCSTSSVYFIPEDQYLFIYLKINI